MVSQAHNVSQSCFFFLKKREFFKVILTKNGGIVQIEHLNKRDKQLNKFEFLKSVTS